MDGCDVRILIWQNIKNLQFQSGSGQVNLPVLIQLMELQLNLFCELWDMAQQASTDSKGMVVQINDINERLAKLAQAQVPSTLKMGDKIHGG